MKFWAKVFKVLGHIWLCLAAAFLFFRIGGVWINEGFSAVQDLLSPYNILNFIFTAFIIAPGLGLLTLSEKLKNKSQS
jgi:hypothetical protein